MSAFKNQTSNRWKAVSTRFDDLDIFLGIITPITMTRGANFLLIVAIGGVGYSFGLSWYVVFERGVREYHFFFSSHFYHLTEITRTINRTSHSDSIVT